MILLLSSCTVLTRSVRYYKADIDDYKVFPQHQFVENKNKFTFNEGTNSTFDTIEFKNKEGVKEELKTILSKTSTRSFIVIRNDSVLFEEYFKGYTRQDFSTVFSVSKSITSLMVGIAIDEGYIESVNDRITKYVTELNDADPMFQKLTIQHLLDMRSGIEFNEQYSNPFSAMACLYYGTNQLAKIKRMHFECEPGTKHEYQSVSTALLGIAIEKARGKSFAAYFEKKVWKPLGMENKGSWSMDDKRHRSSKTYGGLNISAIDLAKIGKLYVYKGKFEGKQIVSEEWINETLSLNTSNGGGYKNQWYNEWINGKDSLGNMYFKDKREVVKLYQEKYSKVCLKGVMNKWQYSDMKRIYREKYGWDNPNEERFSLRVYPGNYSAVGIMKQILYINPKKKIIIVRLGDDNDLEYGDLMFRISEVL